MCLRFISNAETVVKTSEIHELFTSSPCLISAKDMAY